MLLNYLTINYVYLKMIKILNKKFKPRIKARIRKNRQTLNKNLDNFFEWVKGAELVELKNVIQMRILLGQS